MSGTEKMQREDPVAQQFSLDMEFVVSVLGHLLVILLLFFGLTRPESMWRWIGLPVQKKRNK